MVRLMNAAPFFLAFETVQNNLKLEKKKSHCIMGSKT